MELLKLLQRKLLKVSVFFLKPLLGYQSFVMPYLHLPLKSTFIFFLINLNKIETALIFTFALNCNNAWVVSIFQKLLLKFHH